MPLFFLLSGMTIDISKYDNIGIFIKKKAKQLLIPYVVFSMVGFIISYFVYDWRQGLNIKKIIDNFLYRTQPEIFHVGQLWFLIALFIACVLFYFIEKYIVKNRSNLFTFITFFIISVVAFSIPKITHSPDIIRLPENLRKIPFKIDVALMAVQFIKMGSVINKTKFIDELSKISSLCYVFVLFILLLVNIITGPILNGYVNMSDCVYGGYINYFISSIAGMLFILMISYKINYNKILCYYGRNTLVMFAVHSLIIELFNIISKFALNYTINPLFSAITIYIVLFPVAYIYNFIMKDIRKYKIIKISD